MNTKNILVYDSVALIYQYQISIIDISMCFGIKISISTSNQLKISNLGNINFDIDILSYHL